MALIKCKECKKEISDKADKCLHCGVQTKRKTLGCGPAILIVFFVFAGIFAMERLEHKDDYAPSITKTPEEITQFKKKDGTIDPRKNDLDELCKDWVYYKTKIFKYNAEGDKKAATEASINFQAVNRDLSEYRDEDVYETCKKYETREFIERYM